MGAWIETTLVQVAIPVKQVAPHVGAWIETGKIKSDFYLARSLPMWERGLKPAKFVSKSEEDKVAPHVGAWIETEYGPRTFRPHLSLPMWERGLKQTIKHA